MANPRDGGGGGDGDALPHAYTNAVTARGDLVTKAYQGPGALQRQQREELAIRALAGRLPVATVVDARPGVLVLRKVAGRHGQDRIDGGEAEAVMFGLGRLLREVQAITPTFFPEHRGTATTGIPGPGPGPGVLVHHDFGPNNVLFAAHDESIALLADWEWSTVGRPITDLAWAELILRLHHPDHRACLPALFDGYGARPPWDERQAAMVQRAAALEAWVRSFKGARAASTWDRRSRSIAGWREIS